MTPIKIRQYLQERKLATLHDIALHFRSTTEATVPMLDLWVKKGKVKKHSGSLGCNKGCFNVILPQLKLMNGLFDHDGK